MMVDRLKAKETEMGDFRLKHDLKLTDAEGGAKHDEEAAAVAPSSGVLA